MSRPLLLSLALLALPAAAQPGSPARAHEPVVLEGHQVPALLGVEVERVVAYRFGRTGWAPIPVQVDERDTLDVALAYRNGDFTPPGGCPPACQQIFGAIAPMPYWTDPDTWIGPDATDPAFDVDDEVVFMARDAGARRGTLTVDPPGVVAGSRVEVRLTAPEGGTPAYVYLFAAAVAPSPFAPYVAYTPVFCDKAMQSPSDGCDPIPDAIPFTEHYDIYGRGAGVIGVNVGYLLGANPEDTWFEGDTYRLHFSDRWILDSLALGTGGPDLIDRMKLNGFNACGRHERSASLGRGAFIVNRTGPVRAIRAVIGFNSAPLTQRHYVLYDRYFEEHTFFRGHPIALDRGKIGYVDYSEAALGMYYYSNLVEGGFTIDGFPDTQPQGTLVWEAVRGRAGTASGTLVTRFDLQFEPVLCDCPCTELATTGYFEDSGRASPGLAAMQCTGDTASLGASGFRFLPTLPNTDPRPFYVAQHGELYHMALLRRTVLDPTNLPDGALGALRDRLDAPLTVTIDPTDATVGVGSAAARGLAAETRLLPPRPNPSAGRVVVPLTLADEGPVRLTLLDVLGREVRVLHEAPLAAGPHALALDAAGLPAGTYLLHLTTPGGEHTQTLTFTGNHNP